MFLAVLTTKNQQQTQISPYTLRAYILETDIDKHIKMELSILVCDKQNKVSGQRVILNIEKLHFSA